MAMCKYCNSTIEWDETDTGWKATNQDGSRHFCDRSGRPRTPRQVPARGAMYQETAVAATERYDSGVVRLSAERWAELCARLDRIEALLTAAHAEDEWEWPDGVVAT